jgi:type VI secretion system protein ImpH
MAAEGRTDPADLSDLLLEEPRSFEFFQAVRLMTRLDPSRTPVGRDGDPKREAVHFRSSTSLAFPASNILDIEKSDEEDGPWVMTIPFMGVASPASFGSLPLRYTELLLEQERDKNFAFRDFLDLFNHRFISHFYRAWEKYNPTVSLEQDSTRPIESMVLSLIGMGLPGFANRLSFNETALLARSGLLTRSSLPATSLEALLTSYFGVEAEVIQFVPHTYPVDDEEQTRLGQENSVLGRDLLLGASVRLSQFGFRVRMGPMDWNEYQDLLPGGSGFKSLIELVRLAVGEEFEFDIQLILRAPQVPELRLEQSPEQPPLLGWSTWLKSLPFEQDPSDAVFDSQMLPPEDARAHLETN